MRVLRHYAGTAIFALLAFLGVTVILGPPAWVQLSIVSAFEGGFSLDNAVLNARVLSSMDDRWRKRFMTWGMILSVGGVRFAYPVAIVMVTAHLGFGDVVMLAIQRPDVYADRLLAARAESTMLGAAYLLPVFLDFVFRERQPTWLSFVERPLSCVGKLDMMPILVTGVIVLVVSQFVGDGVLIYGVVGLLMFVAINAIASIIKRYDAQAKVNGLVVSRAGWAGFGMFLYVEALDASLSFDGASGAFAVTTQIVVIALGLAIGALLVRAMTLHLLSTGKLIQYRFLEHGAHWAIGVLASCMLVTLFVDISGYAIGLIGVGFVAASIFSSVRYNKRMATV